MDAQVAAEAYRYAVRHRSLFLHYVWDLPPWWLGNGRHDWVWLVGGHYLWLPRLGRRYTTRRGFYSRLRFAAAHACEVWVPSVATAAAVRERFEVACRQVPFCFDSDRFVPAHSPAHSAGLLSVSRLEPHKNHAAVIRAAARFAPPLPVRIIGHGPERGALERLAMELHVRCSIESDRSEAEVLSAYQAAEVVVCPSRFEGFGLTPLEGIACGVPTVASDIPSHREFLGSSAQFFTLDDDDSLVAAIAAARAGPPPSRDVLASVTIDAAADRFVSGLTPYLG